MRKFSEFALGRAVLSAACILIMAMISIQPADAHMYFVGGPEVVRTVCTGVYKVLVSENDWDPISGVTVYWNVIPSSGSGSMTSPSTTPGSGIANSTYTPVDTDFVAEVTLRASGICPPSSLGAEKSTTKKVEILGNPPTSFASHVEFQRYLNTGITYLRMRINMDSTATNMRELDTTIRELRATARRITDSTLPNDVCGQISNPPGPYTVSIASRNSCMNGVDTFINTLIHEGRHLQCSIMFDQGRGDIDGNGSNDNDSDHIVDACDARPNIFSVDPFTGDPSWQDEEDHCYPYADNHVPPGCP